MFEKEAKEYAHEHCCDSCKNLQARYRKVYQDGAEFGYNKANEWHYVKDGDLPSDRHGHVVINQDWDKVTIRNGKFEHLDGYKASVIAWKEIELPKED